MCCCHAVSVCLLLPLALRAGDRHEIRDHRQYYRRQHIQFDDEKNGGIPEDLLQYVRPSSRCGLQNLLVEFVLFTMGHALVTGLGTHQTGTPQVPARRGRVGLSALPLRAERVRQAHECGAAERAAAVRGAV
jgi:hypothetical protein